VKKLSTFWRYPAENYCCFEAEVTLPEQTEIGDVIFVERRDNDVRIMASIPGTFSLADRRNSRGDRRVFACRAVNITPRWVALASPIDAKVGERAIAHLDHFGKIEGRVSRVLARGFVMDITASAEQRDNFAAKIDWLEKHQNHDAHDRRAAPRMTPKELYSCMILADGSRETCLVLDISVLGAAISADTIPDKGTLVKIGLVDGRVVRHFKGGFAVHFVERQSAPRISG
jgi:PilZ domain